MSSTRPVSRPLLGDVQPRLRALVVVLATLVAVIGLGASDASAGAAPDARNGVAAINPGLGTLVANQEPVSPGFVGVSGPVFDDEAVVSPVAPRTAAGAESAAQGARLRTHLRLTQDYGAGGVRELADGRIRYYDVLDPARKPGTMAGRRLVREWDPATGGMRTWHETLDHQGRIRQVRPVENTRHYTFDESGNYTGYWPE